MSEGGGYAFLAQRAYLFLREAAVPVDEDTLIRHLFGALPGQNPARVNVEVWRGLLPGVLSDLDRFLPLGNRMWTLVELQQTDALLGDDLAALTYIALDTETTGLRPDRSRIIELAALRYDPSREFPADSYSSLFNPRARLPAFIVNYTGITQPEVDAAPEFHLQVDAVVAYLGNAIIVGHNVGFDIGFINAELQRAGRPPLVNRKLDTLALAVRLIPNLGKANLGNVATRLGLPVGIRHRAEADARLTHLALQRLLALARERGTTTLDGLLELAKPLGYEYWGKRKDKGVGSRFNPEAWDWPDDPLVRLNRVLVGEDAWLLQMPTEPGAYVFRDPDGEPLYVGKAINLQRRVAGYFGRDESTLRGLTGLIERTATIDLHQTGSELAAILLEAELISELAPPYNTQRAERAPRHYLTVKQTKAGATRLQASDTPDGDPSFGPFSSRAEVDDLLKLLRAIYPALHPRASATASDAEAQLADALAYLRGDREPTLARLRYRLAAATATRDYATESTIRQLLKLAIEAVEKREKLNEESDEVADEGATDPHSIPQTPHSVIIAPAIDPAVRDVFVVRGGRVVRAAIPANGKPEVLTARLAEMWREAGELPPPEQNREAEEQASFLPGVTATRQPVAKADPVSNLVVRWLYAHPDAALSLASDDREAVQAWLREAARLIRGGAS